ncbi:MAG TPA: ATP-dependent DNA ligase, partial [Polyangiaceae bacterium]|nr:ATP-dependent DNA ligase [Polyangiaceae bacterium]
EAMRRLGDLGDAAEELIARGPAQPAGNPLDLADVAELVVGLRADSSRAQRGARLASFLGRASAIEAKYLVKALGGELRIGAAPGVVLLAVAEAFGATTDDVRRAYGVLADLALVAVLASEKRLSEARVSAGSPLAFMLATPIETVKTPIDWPRLAAEEKLDGVRAQVHVHGGVVSIFGRGLERVTDSFPEVSAAVSGAAGDVVLDGEILAVSADGRARPFQALQMRLNRKAPSAELRALVPVRFVAFDLLVHGDAVLVDEPWEKRRAALDAFARSLGAREAFVLNEAFDVEGPAALDAAFERARKNGNEGLVLKRRDAPYDAGRRGQSWLKVKKATATLDVVVTAAEQGHGKRAGVLSDYTFAVWKADALVDVGKAYSGLTDPEIDALSRHFTERTIELRGGWRKVAPDTVLEVGFDGIQRSDRHDGGFALRFPRILRVRDEKRPDEADTLETVEALFTAQVGSGHREEPIDAPKPARKKRAPVPQLSLFNEDPKSRR